MESETGGGGAVKSVLEAPGVQSRLNSNALVVRGDLAGLHTQSQQLFPPVQHPTLPHCPGLTQNTVEAKLLKALAAVGHIPGLRDLHSQVLGPVHGLGTLFPRDPCSTVHIGCV